MKYGKIKGLEKWESYRNKQSKTNMFEYKKEKYGWDEQDFINYNNTRAVTLDNFKTKYGLQKGNEKWESYRNKQKYRGCEIGYFIEKYGNLEGTDFYNNLCKNKAQSLFNFIKRYGEVDGKKRYFDFCNSKNTFYSLKSQTLFWLLDNENCYFAEKNKEFGVLGEHQYYYYDYVDPIKMKCIEFNGDFWHYNPIKYTETDINFTGFTAKEIWKKEKIKLDIIKNRGYDVLVVWENDWDNKPQYIINQCKEFLDG